MPGLYIGCSGFTYSDWKENFYPAGLPQKKWLKHYGTVFKTVELNVTFYRLPLESTFEKWREETPDDFAFSLKGSRYITHIKRLLDSEEPLYSFFERALKLKEKLKVVLWQFSPGFKIDLSRFEKFLKLLKNYPVRNTFEFRNDTWITKQVVDLCGDYGVCLCMADSPGFLDDLPVTADFVYFRRHGEGGSYTNSYPIQALRKDSKRIRKYLDKNKDVFIYFNNDYQGYAPKNAAELIGMLQ